MNSVDNCSSHSRLLAKTGTGRVSRANHKVNDVVLPPVTVSVVPLDSEPTFFFFSLLFFFFFKNRCKLTGESRLSKSSGQNKKSKKKCQCYIYPNKTAALLFNYELSGSLHQISSSEGLFQIEDIPQKHFVCVSCL